MSRVSGRRRPLPEHENEIMKTSLKTLVENLPDRENNGHYAPLL
jgi:hypothetical protein